jgi:hypothetical protein
VVFGGGAFGHIQFTHYDGTNWRVVGGLSRNGRLVCGLQETGFPGTPDATTLDDAPPEHPLTVYNEGTGIVLTVAADGVLRLQRTGTTTPDAPPKNAAAIWQEKGTHDIKVKLTDDNSVTKSFILLPYEPALLAAGHVLKYDATSKTWKNVGVNDIGTQITVLTDWRLDKSGHKFQVKTRQVYDLSSAAESAWTDISDSAGGVLDEGVTP